VGKLLSDEELRAEVSDVVLDSQWEDRNISEIEDRVISLVNSQKIAHADMVIGKDFDIPAEMEKVGRDFQKLDAIAKTGSLLNKFKADMRERNKL